MFRHTLLAAVGAIIALIGPIAYAYDCNFNGIDDSWETSPMGPDDPAGLFIPGSVYSYAIVNPVSGMPQNELTLSLWLKVDNATNYGIFSYAADNANTNEFLLHRTNDLEIYINGNFVATGLNIATGDWLHLAVTWRSSTGEVKIYLNGNGPVYTGTLKQGYVIKDGGCIVLGQDQDTLGGGFDAPQAYEGQLNEVRLWDYARNISEISGDMYKALNGNELGLVGYWRIDEGSGEVLYDDARNQDMTLQECVWVPFTDGDGDGIPDDCGIVTNVTQGTIHSTIQGAIHAASHGDELVAAPHEYVENINLFGKAVTLRSEDPVDPACVVETIINGGGFGTVVTCNSGEGPGTHISGFVITGGDAASGGGMYVANSDPTITHCTVTGNSAGYDGADTGGAGMFNLNADPTVVDCAFLDNQTTNGGGMMNHNSSPIVTNCRFADNVDLLFGGAVYNWEGSHPILTNCSFIANKASYGGAICNVWGAKATFTDCAFLGNIAYEQGGAIYTEGDVTLQGCRLTGNSAGAFGGALLCYGSTQSLTDCTVTSNRAGQYGGGIYTYNAETRFAQSVVCSNSPSQIHGQYVNDGGNLIGPYAPPPASVVADTCPEDIDGDGDVDQADLGALLAMYGQNCP